MYPPRLLCHLHCANKYGGWKSTANPRYVFSATTRLTCQLSLNTFCFVRTWQRSIASCHELILDRLRIFLNLTISNANSRLFLFGLHSKQYSISLQALPSHNSITTTAHWQHSLCRVGWYKSGLLVLFSSKRKCLRLPLHLWSKSGCSGSSGKILMLELMFWDEMFTKQTTNFVGFLCYKNWE